MKLQNLKRIFEAKRSLIISELRKIGQSIDKGSILILAYGAIGIWSHFLIHIVCTQAQKALYYQFVATEEKVNFLLWSLECKLNYTESLIMGFVSGGVLFSIGLLLLILTKKERIERRKSSILLFAVYQATFIIPSIIRDPHLLTNMTDYVAAIMFGALLSTMYHLHLLNFKTELSQALNRTISRFLKVKYLEMKDSFNKEVFRSLLTAFVGLLVGIAVYDLFRVSSEPSPLIASTPEWRLNVLALAMGIVGLTVGCIGIVLELLHRIYEIHERILDL